jgi:outer membrane protein assembly factor BamB
MGLTLAVLAERSSAASANWAQWRGPGSQGVSSETTLPVEWSPTKNIAWSAAIPGRAHSSPIVWGNRVFITTAIEGEVVPGHGPPVHRLGGQEFKHPDATAGDRRHTFKMLAFDLHSGKLLWEHTAHDGPVYDSRHRRSSFAAPTPTTDGRRVYAYFGAEGLYAYNFSGELVWKANVGTLKTVGLGVGTSPILFDGRLILQCDEDEGKESFLVAFDAATGKELWRAPRSVQVSWSTPVLVEANGRTELVTNGTEAIIAYDPKTGKELWRTTGVESNAIHTPLVGKGLIVVTSGYPARRVIAIRPGGSGDVTASHVAWQYARGTAYVTSPILYGDYVYLVSDKGIMTCLDAATGEVKYEGGRPPAPSSFMGSPVAAAGMIFLTSEDGDTYLIKAGPVHEVVRVNSVGEPVFSTPAISQGRILIRGERTLFAIKS